MLSSIALQRTSLVRRGQSRIVCIRLTWRLCCVASTTQVGFSSHIRQQGSGKSAATRTCLSLYFLMYVQLLLSSPHPRSNGNTLRQYPVAQHHEPRWPRGALAQTGQVICTIVKCLTDAHSSPVSSGTSEGCMRVWLSLLSDAGSGQDKEETGQGDDVPMEKHARAMQVLGCMMLYGFLCDTFYRNPRPRFRFGQPVWVIKISDITGQHTKGVRSSPKSRGFVRVQKACIIFCCALGSHVIMMPGS